MSTDLNASFNEQFMNINTKLKKRFLRKPNISEATNEFIALAIQCEYSDQPTFAGHCYIGAAKCEATVGNFLGEAEYLVTAARQFMKAEKKLSSLKFSSPDRENLEAAIGCFTQALTKYPEGSSIRLSILSELANDLVMLNLKCEAVAYYEQALALVQETTMRVMFVRNHINLLIDCEKYDIALEKANELIDSKVNLPEDILAEVQLSRILLSLYMDPKADNKTESLRQLFTNILNDVESEGVTKLSGAELASYKLCFPEVNRLRLQLEEVDADQASEAPVVQPQQALPFSIDLRLKLQSLILSCANRDAQAAAHVACALRAALTHQHQAILTRLESCLHC